MNLKQTKFSDEVTVVANERLAADTFKITLDAPGFVPLVQPGQFALLRLPGRLDPLCGRPFAVYDADPATGRVEIIYLVVGKMTRILSGFAAGDTVELIGPSGNGWGVISGGAQPFPGDRLIMVAGGVGQTPFLLLARQFAQRRAEGKNTPELVLLYGARGSDRMPPLGDFARCGVEVVTATEDGSAGYKGFVTDLIPRAAAGAKSAVIAACGPKPMLRAVFQQASGLSLPCWTSLESPMSCGLGICFGCVVEYRTDEGTWDYRRTCQDGPIFDAYRLKWD